MSLFNKIYSKVPVRRADEQKELFVNLVKQNVTNHPVKVERLNKAHNNIIVGDFEKAEVIFTAHYDTPKRALFANLMIPRNPLLLYTYHFGIYIAMAVVSFFIAQLLSNAFNNNQTVFLISYLALYFSAFYLTTRASVNKHNANDNTSGVVSLMEIARKTNSKKVAFIFFDNEEKGCLGSKAFNKNHGEILKNKLVINLDCVGNGNSFVFIAKPNAEKHQLFENLKNVCKNGNGYNFVFYPLKGSFSNSDYKNFECGIGVSCYTKSKRGVYYTGKIHTAKDKFINEKNISVISQKLLKFVELT